VERTGTYGLVVAECTSPLTAHITLSEKQSCSHRMISWKANTPERSQYKPTILGSHITRVTFQKRDCSVCMTICG